MPPTDAIRQYGRPTSRQVDGFSAIWRDAGHRQSRSGNLKRNPQEPCRFPPSAHEKPCTIHYFLHAKHCRKLAVDLRLFAGTLPSMTIILSHITALRYWLSRPTSAARPQHINPALPTTGVRKGDIKPLESVAARPFHVLCVSPVKGGSPHGITHHTWRTELPAGSLFHTARNVAVCSPELAFLQCAYQLSLINLIRLGFELCGTYSFDRASDGGFFKRPPITTPERLRVCVDTAPRARGRNKASRAISHILPNAASPAETRLAMTLSLPNRLGGFGLVAPQLNQRITLSSHGRKLLGRNHFLCDLYWPHAQLAVEYDSDVYHTTVEKIASDSSRRNALEYVDITVITVTSHTYRDFSSFNATGNIIVKRLGTEIRPRYKNFEHKQLELRRALNPDPPWM